MALCRHRGDLDGHGAVIEVMHGGSEIPLSVVRPCGMGVIPRKALDMYCRTPLLEECPQHHGHKGDPGVTPGTCGAIGEKAQVILVWARAPGRWERLPPTETRSHEG